MDRPFPRYTLRWAERPEDRVAVERLRYRAFGTGQGAAHCAEGRDGDDHDARCRIGLIEDGAGRAAATFRLLLLPDGSAVPGSYSAQFYDLSRLAAYPLRMAELGRFCVEPGLNDPTILRVAWAELARIVDAERIKMLFGCSSFPGCEAGRYLDAFAMLRERHLAPRRWQPRVKAPDVFRFARRVRHRPDPVRAMRSMPPLLKSYLALGGRVSDHAVIDRDLGTLHVFTALEVASIPPARARSLRGLPGDAAPA